MTVRTLPTHSDDRGRLLVAEDADIGFTVRRAFAITAAPAGVDRGDHLVPCRQLMVLVSGRATVRTGSSADDLDAVDELIEPGDAVDLPAGVWVQYRLSGPDAVVLVFAEAPYQARTGDAS